MNAESLDIGVSCEWEVLEPDGMVSSLFLLNVVWFDCFNYFICFDLELPFRLWYIKSHAGFVLSMNGRQGLRYDRRKVAALCKNI